jgi:Asp-tRNA(Asn)/Glu-tRNA(Gln) amidotransferase A subunit family amidase
VELVDDALRAIERLDSRLGAFTVVLDEPARAEAEAVDRRLARGDDPGPLAGVPVAIKDHIWVRGAPATNGSLALGDFVPDVDCECVTRLRDAGAVIVGKTNNPEFCYRGTTDNALYGPTRNPWSLDRTPGGSSGGSAAAVASGMVPLSVGTDGGGSIRIPASFCGIAGHKSTFGLIPKEPGFKGWKTLSVDGPHARTVRDLAVLVQTMSGPSSADDLTWPVPVGDLLGAVDRADVSGKRVAFSADLGFIPVERDVRDVFGKAIAALGDAGWMLEEAAPPPIPPTPIWNVLAVAEGYASEGYLLADWESKMTEGTAELLRAGERVSAGEYIDAQHERARYTRAWSEFFSSYDLLLTPMMELTAIPLGLLRPREIAGRPLDPFYDDWCMFCYPANLTGQPSASVPIGFGEGGLPVGLQIMGRRFQDAAVLEAAAAVEEALPWEQRWPPVSIAPPSYA